MPGRLVESATLLAVASSILLAAQRVQAELPVEVPAAALPKGKQGDHILTCIDHGCYYRYDTRLSCQCNHECDKYNDCCPDFYDLCVETEYSKSGRKSEDKRAPLPDHHKNTPGKDFTTGFIRNIKVGGVVDGRLIVGYQGMGRLYVREHSRDHDKIIKEIRGSPGRPQGPGKPFTPGVPGPNRSEQIHKWGDRGCWYAEFPAPKLPADISVDGVTSEHAGSKIHGKVKKPDVEAHVHAKLTAEGKVDFARNRNFEPATLFLEKHPIPIGEKYQDHPKPGTKTKKIEL